MDDRNDERSLLAKAWGWGYQAMAISLEMVVPALLGLGVDRWLGTLPAGVVLGAIFGMVGGMVHLVQFAKQIGEQGNSPKRRK